MNRDKEIVILYSGGADSTLVAALMASKYKRIHLLTFYTYFMTNVEQTRINVQKLMKKFKHVEFIHKIINIDKIYRIIRKNGYLHDILKYGTFKFYMFNLDLRISMITNTILYCKKNKIDNVAHGANKYSGIIAPSQTKEIMKQIDKLFSSEGITKINPVYDYQDRHPILNLNLDYEIISREEQSIRTKIPEVSKRLYELGLVNIKDVKELNSTKYSTQVEFGLEFFYMIWYMYYFFQLYDYVTLKKLSISYFQEKLKVIKKLI
ncbi:MAG: 7-cyano-7-deazaguanine synthase [Nanoarchaeota archaeon]